MDTRRNSGRRDFGRWATLRVVHMGKPGEFYSEELLHQMFGVNAELLIDHAWGYEPCHDRTDIRAYKPESKQHGLRAGASLSL